MVKNSPANAVLKKTPVASSKPPPNSAMAAISPQKAG